MPRVTDAHRAARRQEILDAVERVVLREGFRGASMGAIIAESGLSAGAIYSYFDGKQALFRAVAESTIELRLASFGTANSREPRSPAATMRAILRALSGTPLLAIAPQVWAEATVEPEIRGIAELVFTRLRAVLEPEFAAWARANPERITGTPDEWAHRVAPVLVSIMPGYVLQRVIVPDFDEDAYLAAFTAVLPD
jgi:TetR/AcrR family transcriptional regulator, transcriptional repressor of aconitase